MSESKKNTETVFTSVSKLFLVRQIAALLNLGDEGKLESFFQRVNKRLKKDNTLHTKNLENLKFNHEQTLDTLKDKLEDANEALQGAFTHVDINAIQTNGQQDQYVEVYMDNVDSHLARVQSVEKEIERENEGYEKEAKNIQDQIDSNAKRLSVIGKEV